MREKGSVDAKLRSLKALKSNLSDNEVSTMDRKGKKKFPYSLQAFFSRKTGWI